MAKGKLNPIFETLSGRVGNQVFKQYHGRLVVTKVPDMSHVVFSEAQLAQQERFRRAIQYAKQVRADPELRRPYQRTADCTGKTLQHLLVADFMHAPVIESLELADYTGKIGDPIVIQAHDDFELTALQVRLTNAAGATLEMGVAEEEPPGTGRWVYSAQTAQVTGTKLTIIASAVDRPGNQTEKTADKTI